MATEVTSINHLPNDTVQSILSRLPVQTLLTLRSVSKSWKSIISDPTFVRIHLQRQHHPNTLHNLFLRKLSTSHRGSIIDHFSLVRARDKRLDCPRPGWHNVLCTCEGVMLLTIYSRDSYRAFMLWNPSTRTESKLFSFPYKFQCRPAKHGLCHDPVTGDFKVVVAFDKHYAVYSCKDDAWSEPMDFRYSCEMGATEGVFVDGVIYWVALDGEEEACQSREIIYFDPKDDGFKKLEKPEDIIQGIGNGVFNLVVLRGCLCLYGHTRSDKTAIRIWMKEKGQDRNAWTELMMIENEKPDVWFKPMCLLENNTKILLELEREGFVVYNPCEKTFGEINDYSCFQVKMFPCWESLLFPLECLRRPKRKRSRPLKFT
ncbi:F-box protein cpr30 [Phtheirospermum japonicum]|uniref:F-box protein cpr30 n=1 Tax=Phtheirospermum japonicum TaxID=374723 RepID=A0A830CY06_9LAMI|nr:F-box protein cpr30 [Phtheirospermum japonicum]